jgi:hypothetical protein
LLAGRSGNSSTKVVPPSPANRNTPGWYVRLIPGPVTTILLVGAGGLLGSGEMLRTRSPVP